MNGEKDLKYLLMVEHSIRMGLSKYNGQAVTPELGDAIVKSIMEHLFCKSNIWVIEEYIKEQANPVFDEYSKKRKEKKMNRTVMNKCIECGLNNKDLYQHRSANHGWKIVEFCERCLLIVKYGFSKEIK